jgi:hypothetical protein
LIKFASSVRLKVKDRTREAFTAALLEFDIAVYPGSLSVEIINMGGGRF